MGLTARISLGATAIVALVAVYYLASPRKQEPSPSDSFVDGWIKRENDQRAQARAALDVLEKSAPVESRQPVPDPELHVWRNPPVSEFQVEHTAPSRMSPALQPVVKDMDSALADIQSYADRTLSKSEARALDRKVLAYNQAVERKQAEKPRTTYNRESVHPVQSTMPDTYQIRDYTPRLQMRAVVVVGIKHSWFVVEDLSSYALLEWWGGPMPNAGDTLWGDINSFGFKDLVYAGSTETRVWVDDYWLTRSRAVEKLMAKP